MERNFIIAILILSIFTFILAVSSLYVEIQITTGNTCSCAIPLWLFVPLLGSLGLFIGALTYSLIKPEKTWGFSVKDVQEIILKFIRDEREKLVLNVLFSRKKLAQSEIVKETGLDRVTVHRILKRFETLGLVVREKDGRSVKVMLSNKLAKIVK